MIRHLRTAHDMSYEFGERPMTPEDQRSLTYGLAVCILRDRISMFFVQSDGFRNWMQFVKPSFQVPHRTTIRYYIREACKLLKRDLRRRISQLKHIALTNDSWTSRANDSFLIMTAHWVTSNFTHESCTLAVRPIYTKHTAPKICALMKQVLDDYQFQGDVVAKTHDNGSNFVNANVDADYAGPQWIPGTSIRCYAHSLNLAVKHHQG